MLERERAPFQHLYGKDSSQAMNAVAESLEAIRSGDLHIGVLTTIAGLARRDLLNVQNRGVPDSSDVGILRPGLAGAQAQFRLRLGDSPDRLGVHVSRRLPPKQIAPGEIR